MAPEINLDNRWRSVASVRIRPFYSRRKSLGVSESQSERSGEENDLLLLPGIEHRFLDRVTCVKKKKKRRRKIHQQSF